MTKETSTNIINRMAVILLSFGFCAFFGMAQKSIPERLNYVLENQDMEIGIKLYNEITDEDLKQLPDSVLFNYHCLGAYINTELSTNKEKDRDKALIHFLDAKHLCETSIGVHSGDYMEVMRGLGDVYIELGQYEEAAYIYQEGIVKSMYMREAAPHDFGNLIVGLQDCYEMLGWFGEIPSHLHDAWLFWNKDQTPLVTYTYYPLWRLEQFYKRYEMYDDAIKVSDTIIRFISEKGGSNHPELAEALYMRGNIFIDMNLTGEGIDAYQKGLSVLCDNGMENSELFRLISGNLLMVLTSEERFGEIDELLESIRIQGLQLNNSEFYKNALFSVVNKLGNVGNKRRRRIEYSAQIYAKYFKMATFIRKKLKNNGNCLIGRPVHANGLRVGFLWMRYPRYPEAGATA